MCDLCGMHNSAEDCPCICHNYYGLNDPDECEVENCDCDCHDWN